MTDGVVADDHQSKGGRIAIVGIKAKAVVRVPWPVGRAPYHDW